MSVRQESQHQQHQQSSAAAVHFGTPSQSIIYSNHPYGDSSGYLQMALGAYLTPSGGGTFKSVDPYFLSQGEFFFHQK